MTDVAGSTRLWEARAEAMRAAIRRHDAIVQTAVDNNGGQLIKERGEGDSHFCVFVSSEDAVRAAIQIQKHLPQEQWETGTPLVVRMSIHRADVEPHGGDYYGRDVNRCARIRAAAHGGQILVSDDARDSIQSFDFLDLGLHRLNDLSEQQRIYQVIAPDIQRDFPPIKSLNAVKHNLPVQLTSFIGREKELDELRKLRMGLRLVSILGPGGTGKTRTALQLAAESVEDVPGGVWFVDLSPITDGSSLVQKVIEDLFVRVGADEPDDAIAAHFRGEKTLLVLDNCEHVARDAAVFVEKLLRNSPNVYVIATSREPLGVAGERSYRLPPMSVEAESVETLEDISQLDSVRLLLDRARTKGHEQVIEQSKPSTILELCRRLDGIPLALEQAASNLGVLSPESMLQRLEERLSILSMDDEGVQARHRTLSAAIDWSYDALNEEERNLFLDLAVFSGGWTLEAAEHICEQKQVLPLMQRLVAKSLVAPEATSFGDRRFRLLETMREYALERRRDIPQYLKHRHLAYYSHLAKLAEAAGLDVDDQKWKRILDQDHPNFIAAFQSAIHSEEDSEEALEFAVSMFDYWHRRDFYRQASAWYQAALDAAPNAAIELRANALNQLGIFSIYQRKLGPAKTALQASLQLWRQTDNVAKVGAVLNNLSWVAQEEGDSEEARRLLNEVIPLFAESGRDGYLAQALQNLAQIDANEGRREQAIQGWKKAIALLRQENDKINLLTALSNLLGCYAESSGLSEHFEAVEEVLNLARYVDNAELTASSLDLVAYAAQERGQSALAARFIGAATNLEESVGVVLTKHLQPFRDRLSVRTKEELGRQAYRKEFEAGRRLSSSQALDQAKTFIAQL